MQLVALTFINKGYNGIKLFVIFLKVHKMIIVHAV